MMSEESKELFQVAIKVKKRLDKEENLPPFFRCTNQWRNEVGVVSKQVRGDHFPTYLGSPFENKLKTHRITVVEPTADVSEIKIMFLCCLALYWYLSLYGKCMF